MSRLSSRQVRSLIDGALDGALDAPSKAQLAELLRADAALNASFAAERHTLSALKDVAQPRDLTAPILAKVQEQRAFLSRSARLRVWAGRGSIAAAILLAVGGIALFHRINPGGPWSSGPGPVAEVEANVRSDAASGASTLADALGALGDRTTGPLAPVAGRPRYAPRPVLPLGDTSDYTPRLTYRVAGDVQSPSGNLGVTQSRRWARAAGIPDNEEGFVVSTVRWSPNTADRRALRCDWEPAVVMRVNVSEDAAATERSWWLRFWMNSQPSPPPSAPGR